MSSTLVSAPGKVLLAGGFLVLDPKYFGIVIATSARFYTLVRPSSSPSNTGSESEGGSSIVVRAAQFPRQESTWRYTARSPGVVEPAASAGNENKFVQLTLHAALSYASAKLGWEKVRATLGEGLEVVVLADNDFYSQSDKVGYIFHLGSPTFERIGADCYPFIARPTRPSLRSHPCPTPSRPPTKRG